MICSVLVWIFFFLGENPWVCYLRIMLGLLWAWFAVGSGLGLPWAMGLALLPFFFSFLFFAFFFWLESRIDNFFFYNNLRVFLIL